MNIPQKRATECRQRILETADRLFYTEGIRAVGIDRVIAEADVAKMTLYKHFPSKDDLILAVLHYRASRFDAMILESMAHHGEQGLNRLEAFFAALKDWFDRPDFRGCSFINTSVELADDTHAAARFSAEFITRFQGTIHSVLAETAGPAVAQRITEPVLLLVEGAVVMAMIGKSAHVADVARDATMTLVVRAKRA